MPKKDFSDHPNKRLFTRLARASGLTITELTDAINAAASKRRYKISTVAQYAAPASTAKPSSEILRILKDLVLAELRATISEIEKSEIIEETPRRRGRKQYEYNLNSDADDFLMSDAA